jgi:lysophospholipase L1-like esterase
LKLKNYVVAQRQSDPNFFGKGQFLASGSLGSGNALWEVSDKSVHPTFQGTKMLLEDSIPLTGAKKVYMMLGMNDVALYGIDGALENYATLLDRIQASAPDVEFYIESVTPICQGAEKGSLNNANIEEYNARLQEWCQERGMHYIDVAQVMRDQNGYLPRAYCSDPDGMGIHMTDEGCKIWLGYLLEDAKLLQGT